MKLGYNIFCKKYDWGNICVYNKIISKYLRNNPTEHFYSINEICTFYKKIKEIEQFDSMYKLHEAVLSVVLEFFNKVIFITDRDVMYELFNCIFECKCSEVISNKI